MLGTGGAAIEQAGGEAARPYRPPCGVKRVAGAFISFIWLDCQDFAPERVPPLGAAKFL
jgi:hypothetical protein